MQPKRNALTEITILNDYYGRSLEKPEPIKSVNVFGSQYIDLLCVRCQYSCWIHVYDRTPAHQPALHITLQVLWFQFHPHPFLSKLLDIFFVHSESYKRHNVAKKKQNRERERKNWIRMYDNQQQRTDGRINGIMTHLYYLLHLCFARLFTSAFYYFLSVLVRFGGRSFLIFMSVCLCLSFSIYRERDSIFFISVFTFY